MEDKITKWILESLSKFLDCDVPPTVVSNILNLHDDLELEEYLHSLLNYHNPAHRLFIDKLLMRNERKHCECQCTKHALINNCLKCGRVVCALEGSGPCYFCGEIVCTYDELSLLRSSDRQKANAFYARLLLLERPRKTDIQTSNPDNITDIRNDLSAFESTYNWKCSRLHKDTAQLKHLRKLEKEEIKKKRDRDEMIKRLSHPTIDFYGWKDKHVGPTLRMMIEDLEDRVQHNLWIKSKTDEMLKLQVFRDNSKQMRVQDKERQMMCDSKKCLAIDQPMASLLMEGKKTEIMTNWYSPIRGRLWIASTAHQVDEKTSSELKDIYPDLPSKCPPNALLGFSTLEDCLMREDIENTTPTNSNTEDIKPYVFVFSNPITLPTTLQIEGAKGIFPLESTVHKAAIEIIRSSKMAL